MDNKPLVSPRDMLDIIFAERNRAYGAYQLRRDYPGYLLRALSLGLLLIAILLVLPRLLRAVTPAPAEKAASIVFDPGLPPDIVAAQPPPPPRVETPPPPVRATMRFVPPVVEQDAKVPDETPPAAQEELAAREGEVGIVDRTGTTDGPPTELPDDLTGSGIVEPAVRQGHEEIYNGEFSDLQKRPSFPGGEAELFRYLSSNIEYPSLAREAGIQGVVALTFVVKKDGSIDDIRVLKELGGGCTKEAVRVVKNMPRWSPGEANGQLVNVRFTLPVRFRLR